ncbi:unnamed protein product [Scytosiphon promiscuus]
MQASMPVTSETERDIRGVGVSAANEMGATSGANSGTSEQVFAGSRCLEALVVAVNQVSERSRWYTETKELQLSSLQLCEACRIAHNVHLRVHPGTPTALLAAVESPHDNADEGVLSRVPRLQARRLKWLLPSLDLLSKAEDNFAQVEELHFGDAFNSSLVLRTWPYRLRSIGFGFSSRFNQPIVEVVWPVQLQQLSFGRRFNQSVEEVEWPKSLRELKFGYKFDHSIEGVKWPSSLLELTLTGKFNQPIDGVKWPSMLLKLKLVGKFNQPIEGVKWPIALRLLTFGYDFNQSVEGVTWPVSLQQLTFGFSFNQPIADVTWPTKLQQLTFGLNFNQPVDGVTWPPSLEELTLGEHFNQPIQGTRWPLLRHLVLAEKFRQPLQHLGTVVPSLERFTLHLGFNFTSYHLLRGIEWPNGLTHLAVGKYANLDGISIPSGVSVSYLWCR